MKRSSPDVWLATAAVFFLVCLTGVAYAHHNYVVAESAYQFHLSHVAFGPHMHISATLNGYAQAASSRLRAQTILVAATLLAIINVLLQVVRRRNNRMAVTIDEGDRTKESA